MSAQPMVTEWGEEHGLVNEVGNSVQDDGMKRFSEKDRPAMEKLKKEQSRMVKARYINYRGQNERLDKIDCRWAGEKIRKYHLIPGFTYDVPMGMVEEVNRSGVAKRSQILDAQGVPTKVDGQMEKIHELVSVSF
jgi:hypothetical protein